jgi:proteasome lid subunit RPN8/RPN11
MTNINQQLSLDEIVRGGKKFYFDELQGKLEKEHVDEYAVIDVEQMKYRVDPDELTAIRKAQQAFGEKLFYIVHIGSLRRPSMNFTPHKYAWNF